MGIARLRTGARMAGGVALLILFALRQGISADSGPPGDPPQDSRRLRILFTANTLGYIEPCDCGTTRRGGLDRRAAVVTEAREPGQAVLLFDLGNVLEIPGGAPTRLGGLQAEFLIEEMVHLGYDLVALGARDLQGDPSFFSASLGGLNMPLLLTNLAPGAELGVPVTPVRRFETAGIVLEVFAVVEPARAGGHAGLLPWEPALRLALERSAEHPDPADVRVVIAHLSPADLDERLASLDKVDLILDGTSMAPRQAWRRHQSVLMAADSRGQQVARLDLTVVPRRAPLRGNRAGIVGFQGWHIPLQLSLPGDQDVRRRMEGFRSRLLGRGLIPPRDRR